MLPVAMRDPPAHALVGRGAALRAIDRALSALGKRRGGALRVAGEPGIGKTRVLAELAARADARGFVVLDGRAAEFEDDLPFGAFVDALDDDLRARGRLAQFDPAALPYLSGIFPALTQPGGEPAPPVLEERFRSHRAVRALLAQLALNEPLVLVLDDVHWADPASAELLGYLLAHPPAGPVLLAVGYRPAQLCERLRSALEAQAGIEVIELGPLSRDDARTLVGMELSEAAYVESGGNPFYLLELMAAARPPGSAGGWVGSLGGEVPGSVRAAIDREIAGLPDPPRALARGAAVAGDPFDAELAAVAAGAADGLEALDRLVASGLVRPTDVPTRFAFRHPLVRRAVYESAAAGWRIAAHRRLAEALRRRGAPPAELAHHVEVAAAPGDEHAIEVLTAAARAVARQAPAITARRLRTVLRLLPQGAPGRFDALVELAGALAASMRLDECRDALVEALSLLPPEASGSRAALEASCARVEHWIGLHEESQARLRRALDALPDRRAPEAAALMTELAECAHWDSDGPALRRWAGRAAEVAHDAGDRPAEAAALALLALGHYWYFAPQPGIEALDRAAAIVDALPDEELAKRPDGTFHVAYHESLYERYERALRHADRGLAVARATGQGQFALPTLVARSLALRLLGRLDEAAEVADEAVEGGRLAEQDQLTLFALATRSWIATAQGDLDLALATGEEAMAMARRFARTMSVAGLGWILGAALVEAGQWARCVTLVLEAVQGPDAATLGIHACLAWDGLARAEVRRGRHEEARAWIERFDAALPGLTPLAYPRALAESARAELLLATGDPAGAARAALTAAEAADGIGARVEAARARLLAGRALAAAEQRDDAVALLEDARAVLDECGAALWRDEAARELRRLGRAVGRGGRRRSARAGVEALSDRERQIADLVAAGRTNKDIAAQLFLSPRTVERHLSHAFAKLGVSSRAQIGAALRGD